MTWVASAKLATTPTLTVKANSEYELPIQVSVHNCTHRLTVFVSIKDSVSKTEQQN